MLFGDRRGYLRRGRGTVHFRHPQVENRQVRRQFRRELDGFKSVFRLGDDFESLLLVDKSDESFADDLMVVSEQDF